MFSKVKKYIIGFFVLCGGLLMAFLTGKSAGKKNEKVKNVKKNIKETKKAINTKKKKISNVKKKTYKKKNVGTKEAADYLKKFAKGKKK
tara:strand:- start:1912 stop:2178 length:267 start_codon:yes stop_codon:yes gene_type:complete